VRYAQCARGPGAGGGRVATRSSSLTLQNTATSRSCPSTVRGSPAPRGPPGMPRLLGLHVLHMASQRVRRLPRCRRLFRRAAWIAASSGSIASLRGRAPGTLRPQRARGAGRGCPAHHAAAIGWLRPPRPIRHRLALGTRHRLRVQIHRQQRLGKQAPGGWPGGIGAMTCVSGATAVTAVMSHASLAGRVLCVSW